MKDSKRLISFYQFTHQFRVRSKQILWYEVFCLVQFIKVLLFSLHLHNFCHRLLLPLPFSSSSSSSASCNSSYAPPSPPSGNSPRSSMPKNLEKKIHKHVENKWLFWSSVITQNSVLTFLQPLQALRLSAWALEGVLQFKQNLCGLSISARPRTLSVPFLLRASGKLNLTDNLACLAISFLSMRAFSRSATRSVRHISLFRGLIM